MFSATPRTAGGDFEEGGVDLGRVRPIHKSHFVFGRVFHFADKRRGRCVDQCLVVIGLKALDFPHVALLVIHYLRPLVLRLADPMRRDGPAALCEGAAHTAVVHFRENQVSVPMDGRLEASRVRVYAPTVGVLRSVCQQ